MSEKHFITIVTYNRLSLLKECLDAAITQTKAFDGIVVVDNASTDGTAQYLKEWLSSDNGASSREAVRKVVRAKTNSGGAGGFAKGIKEAVKMGADWITIIDDDAIIRPDYLQQICKCIASDEEMAGGYAGVPLTDGIRIGHRRRVTGRVIKREVPVPLEEYEKEAFQCDIASFCGLTISAEIVKGIGYPEKKYFIWYDDTEYCLRISKIGSIKNCNQAVIDHKVLSKSNDGGGTWKDYYGIRNRLDMSIRHYNKLTAILIAMKKGLNIFGICLRRCLQGEWKQAGSVFDLYADAVRDGFQGRLGRNRKYLP